jgi:predicted Zn-dependent peptidase
VIGDREVIVTTPREKMVTLKERYYVPNNSALLFAGDIKPDEAYALADELFSDWKAAGDPHKLYPEPPMPPLKQSSTIAVIQPVQTATLQIEWQGPSMQEDTPSTFAADTLSFILLQPNSRFYKNLIDSGLFDNANLFYFSQAHTGPITAFGTTTPERLDRAQAALLREISHFTDANYFSDEELAFAKNQLEFSEIYGRERPSQFVHTVSFWWASGSLDYYRNYLDNLRKVSRADIQNYVRRYITGKPSVTGVLTSQDDVKKIALLNNAEVIRPTKGSSATAMAAGKAEGQTEAFDVDGLHVILRKNTSSEVVNARAIIKGGLAASGPEHAGMELLMLNVSEKQSANYPKEKMARELTRLGAQVNESATADDSTFTLTALQRNFADSMRIFLDALVRPVFTESEVALARERRLTELRQEEQNPDSFLVRLALQNEYRNHPYGADPLGTPELVKSVTAQQLRELHASLDRSRILLVVVGNVTRQELEALLRPAVKDLPSHDWHAPQLPPIPDADRARSTFYMKDLPTVYVTGFFPAPGLGSDDYPAAMVAMNVLSHRLFEEIRTKRNLSYAPYSGLRESALSLGQLYVTTPDPNAALKVMRDEIEKMRTTPVSETELKDQVRQMKTGLLANMQASADIAAILGDWELLGGGWQNFDLFLHKLDDVTPEQVRKAMDRYARKVDFALLGNVNGVDRALVDSF